ncbi:spatacsin-like [Clytia hemisphaerica]|uniref:Spatacsin C-terminal domain-containing protein n=1 Tax=Clytia hemisphaerica TaxID=252671 RepID=A0A7M5UQR1_9CNID
MTRITNQLPMTSTPKKDQVDGNNQGHGQKLQHGDDLQLLDDTHFQEMSEIPNSNNLVDLLLQCDDNNTPWRKLLAYSLAVFNPLLTVLAACYEEADCWECLCVWYVCSVNEEMRFKICSSILDIKDEDAILMLRNHRWSNEDLLTIVKCLLTEGVKYAKLICHGFIIFRKTDPLLYLVQFLEAYMFNREEKHTLSLLVDFQTEYKAYRNRNNVSKTFSTNHDSYYCENFAFSCITLLLEKSPSTLHSYKLLHYLADSKFGFMFERQVPNFQLCKQTADILYPTGVQFSVQRLCTTNIESFDQEVYALYERLLDSGAFDESYSFAKLHSLPESNITLQKLRHELKLLRNKECWVDLESRCNFWRYAHRTFTEMDCLPELSAQFFEEQSLPSTHEMLSFEERVQLLKLSIRWLKCCQNVDVHKVSQLERTIWLYKIKGVKQIQQTGQPLPTIILDEWKSDTIFSFQGNIDRKCSDVSYVKNLPVTELVQNEEMDRLFVNEKESLENSGEFVLKDVKEEKAFDWLVGNLLDDLHITEARKVTNYFQKTTTDLEIVLTAIQLAQGQIAVERCSDTIKSILAGTTSRHISVSGILERSGSFSRPESLTKHIRTSGASDVMVDFVFIEEVQNALEKLTLRVTHGKRCCQQVLICFKIANILSRSYEEIVSDDRMNVLKSVFESPFDQRRQLAKQFIKAFDLSIDEVSTFIADTVISWTRIICGEEELILEAVTLVTVEESRVPTNEDILSLVQLAENTSLLGTMLLEEAVNISNEVTSTSKIGKLSYQVELLVYAHYCFTITCDMEGIAGVLRTTQHCTKRLAKRNQYSLMVRLLTGIGRFREMFYVIETLYNQHHFEVLCRKGKGDVKENQLKMALLDFMKRYHPEDVENLNMISVGFGMYREAAEHLEKQGRKEIERIKHDLKSGASKEVSNTLEEIRKTFSYAAENYSKEECLYLEQSCTRLAHLAKLQIQLLPSGVQVLGLTKLQTQEFLNTHQDFVEALVVADCYDFRDPAIWSEPIYRMVVIKGNFNYLDQFQSFFQLNSTIIGNVALRFRSDRANQSPNNMKKLLTRLRDVRSKLKIARELNFTDVENKLLEGSSGVYLRDNTF